MIVKQRALKRQVNERRGNIFSKVYTIVTPNVILYLANARLIINNIYN